MSDQIPLVSEANIRYFVTLYKNLFKELGL